MQRHGIGTALSPPAVSLIHGACVAVFLPSCTRSVRPPAGSTSWMSARVAT